MRSRAIHTALLVILTTAVIASGVAAQARVPGENPLVHDVFTADPATLVYRDTVYLYVGHDQATGDQMFNMNEWLLYTSTDMRNWTPRGTVMKVTDFTWAVRDAWAAQVVEKDGRFYFFTTAQHGAENSKAIGVAVADHPAGPFVDARGSALVTDRTTPSPNGWDDIDPTAFVDADGTAWLAWGNPNLYLARLAPGMTEFDGPIRQLYLPNYTEGPWLHRRGDTYYLSYACFAHQGMWEKICYATAPAMTGPWTYRGIITDQTRKSYTIHPAIMEYRGQWYFFYHDALLTVNGEEGGLGRRAVALEYLFYNDDGTIRPIRQTREGVSRPPAPGTRHEGPVFHPDPALAPAPVPSNVVVIQHEAPGAERWPAGARVAVTEDPRNTAVNAASFSRSSPASLGQTVTVETSFRLERISLYAGDGYGTSPANAVTVAVYDLGTGVDTTMTEYVSRIRSANLLGSDEGLMLNYLPQAQGLLHIDLPASRQPTLQAGHTYVIELQGVRDGAPLFWRRTRQDAYAAGAAFQNRELFRERSRSADFAVALYGPTAD